MNSSWAALRNPIFRRLWIASLISGTCMAAHNSAVTYMMSTLAASPLLISLISTVASLPFFLFTVPAGALADRVDRKNLLCAINLWLAGAAVALAILGWVHLLNPYLILAGVFFFGIGFAFDAPTWTSIVSQIVSDRELPSAATLNGLQLNISGLIGPALGGLLLSLVGANLIFIANAAGFLVVILAIRQWKQPFVRRKVSSQSFSFGKTVRCLACTPELQVVLARNFLFALFISAIPAVVPVIGLEVLHFNSFNLGLLFTSMGAGSVVGSLIITPWFRTRFSPNTVTLSANLLLILVYMLMGVTHQTELFFLLTAFAGVGWTLSANELWVAAQRAMPSWARGRMNAAIIVASQGAMVLGGLIWGTAIGIAGPGCALFGAAVLFLISLLLDTRLSIDFTANLHERASSVPSVNVKSEKVAPVALPTGLSAA